MKKILIILNIINSQRIFNLIPSERTNQVNTAQRVQNNVPNSNIQSIQTTNLLNTPTVMDTNQSLIQAQVGQDDALNKVVPYEESQPSKSPDYILIFVIGSILLILIIGIILLFKL